VSQPEPLAGPAPCPPQARQAAEAACGGRVELERITDRRGSAVWKATGPAGAVAVKAGYGDGAPITGREAAVLDAMGTPGHMVASGHWDGGAWLVTRWFPGPSTSEVFQPVRDGSGGHEAAVSAAVELCQAVADLHASGWVHADLQPSHGIHTPQGVRLVDLSWSWRPGFEQSGIFRGGIPHLLAPELAASVSRGERPVKPSAEAEVYALAGALWMCVAGVWPLDYVAAGIDRRHTTPDDLRAAIATGRIPLTAPTPWPGFQDVLRSVLAAPFGARPTAADLAAALRVGRVSQR
jgi:hypothetical protein